jgi:hypothetical protein
MTDTSLYVYIYIYIYILFPTPMIQTGLLRTNAAIISRRWEGWFENVDDDFVWYGKVRLRNSMTGHLVRILARFLGLLGAFWSSQSLFWGRLDRLRVVLGRPWSDFGEFSRKKGPMRPHPLNMGGVSRYITLYTGI